MTTRKPKPKVSKDQVAGIVRTALAAGIGYLSAKGLIGQPEIDALAAILPLMGVAAWSVLSKR